MISITVKFVMVKILNTLHQTVLKEKLFFMEQPKNVKKQLHKMVFRKVKMEDLDQEFTSLKTKPVQKRLPNSEQSKEVSA